MKIDKFESLWHDIFSREDRHFRQWETVLAKLIEAGIITIADGDILKPDSNLAKFHAIWLECHSENEEYHYEEMRKIEEVFIRSRVLFANDEVEAKFKLKVYSEEVFIRWIIDAYADADINNAMKFLIDDLKLTPGHFSDIKCQTLWRIIIDKYNKKEPFGAANIIDAAGFIGYDEFYEFYFKEDDKQPPRQVFIEFTALIHHAEKIMSLNELLKEELEKQDKSLTRRLMKI